MISGTAMIIPNKAGVHLSALAAAKLSVPPPNLTKKAGNTPVELLRKRADRRS
jgi:hypothetical protein